MPEMTVKEAMRQEMMKMRKAMTPEEVREKSAEITARLLGLPEYAAATAVIFYGPKGNEVQIGPAITGAIRKGRITLLPVASGNTVIPVRITDYPEGLEKGPLGMPQPRSREEYRGSIDAAVIPGLAFDLRGYRLGRGGGHYDRMLEKMKIFRIGLAYDFQVIKALPAEEHDQRMDIVLTESRTIRCGK